MLEKLVLNSSMYLSTQDVDDAMLQFDSMPRNEYEKEIKRKRIKTSCATHVSFVVIVDFVSYTRELMWVCDVKRTCNQRSIDSHSENSLRNSIPFSLFIRFLSSLFWTHLTRVVHTHKILYIIPLYYHENMIFVRHHWLLRKVEISHWKWTWTWNGDT